MEILFDANPAAVPVIPVFVNSVAKPLVTTGHAFIALADLRNSLNPTPAQHFRRFFDRAKELIGQ